MFGYDVCEVLKMDGSLFKFINLTQWLGWFAKKTFFNIHPCPYEQGEFTGVSKLRMTPEYMNPIKMVLADGYFRFDGQFSKSLRFIELDLFQISLKVRKQEEYNDF